MIFSENRCPLFRIMLLAGKPGAVQTSGQNGEAFSPQANGLLKSREAAGLHAARSDYPLNIL
jgi:hypothetical protein